MTDAEYDLVKARSFFNKQVKAAGPPVEIRRAWSVIEGSFTLDPDAEYDASPISSQPPFAGTWPYDTLAFLVFPPDNEPYQGYAVKTADDQWLEIAWPDGDD